jgi:3-phenylpropionate/cinnamic acid dioxygenase small subunit
MSGPDIIGTRCVGLVALESRLLDEARYAEWLELFAEDAHYWVPLTPGQQDPLQAPSLMYEDKLMLRMRVQRIAAAAAPSLQTVSRCVHILQTATVEAVGASSCLTRCPFFYIESRGDQQQIWGGIAWHHWEVRGENLLIGLKRIDLVNCEAALPALHLFP